MHRICTHVSCTFLQRANLYDRTTTTTRRVSDWDSRKNGTESEFVGCSVPFNLFAAIFTIIAHSTCVDTREVYYNCAGIETWREG